MSKVSEKCWHNGCLIETSGASPSIASISFHMGTGVFDGLMAYWNRDHYLLHEARAHLERLASGAGRMGMKVPWTVDELLQGIHCLLATVPEGDYYVRPIVYRGAAELWLTGAEGRPVDVSIFLVPVRRGIRSAIACELSPTQRVSSSAMPVSWKVCGLYVNSFLARRGAEQRGFQDGLMLDRNGRIAEFSAANVFFLYGDELCTPPLNDDVFPGITRDLILRIASELGIACVERDIFPAMLSGFRGVFLCSTLMEIRPVTKVGEISYATEQEECYRRICAAFDEITSR